MSATHMITTPSRTIREIRSDKGFTLIELSIVLVIIGLVVGGVLVGQDLIRAAGERAQISQIEKFNSAANSFYGKYGYLPGDLPAIAATQFGLTPRNGVSGQGDGNGLIQGGVPGYPCGVVEDVGEPVVFWQDLTYANGQNVNLIEGSFNSVSNAGTFLGMVSGRAIAGVLPAAKIGNGNYIYVYSTLCGGSPINTVRNYFGLSAVTLIYNDIENSCQYCSNSVPALTVRQAYDIDAKIDDGLPTTGNVIAQYLLGGWIPAPNAASPSAATCYDTTSNNYSTTVSNGNNVACALSFKMQAGD